MSKKQYRFRNPIEHEKLVLDTLVWWMALKELNATYSEWAGLIHSTPNMVWESAYNHLFTCKLHKVLLYELKPICLNTNINDQI